MFVYAWVLLPLLPTFNRLHPPLSPLTDLTQSHEFSETQENTRESLSIGGPFGLFSTGTNFVCALFKKNGIEDVGGCNFYRQKHKPPAVLHDFLFCLAEVKRYRIWFHTFVEHLLRTNSSNQVYNKTYDGFTQLMTTVNNDSCFGAESYRSAIRLNSSSSGCCCSTPDSPSIILAAYNRTILRSSWGGVFRTKEGTASE
jgi:hypothetical protein